MRPRLERRIGRIIVGARHVLTLDQPDALGHHRPLSSITASSACLPEIALNPAMACFRCVVAVLIDGSFRYRYREVFHEESHASTFNGL